MKSKMEDLPLSWLEKFLRYVDYLGAAQLYLKDNFFLKKPLKKEHIKERILGHWGTVPGLSFIYAHCNYLISKRDVNMIFVAGPGHGAPGVMSCLFAEGTLGEIYPGFEPTRAGTGNLIKQFSWPGGFPSHLTPMSPGSILEGGELGYSLATAYGAALDNPDLVVACVVGDGEAETGPLSAAWHSNKFLNPAESGAVLPVLHDNGYKISGPTIYGTMKNEELMSLFTGFGYQVRIVEPPNLHRDMQDAMFWAHDLIRKIQKKARMPLRGQTEQAARSGKRVVAPKWPMIILRTLKGWTGVKQAAGKKIEGNFRSHGIPLTDPQTNPETLRLLEEWLRSYCIEELVDSTGAPRPEILEFIPKENRRMGKNPHAYGGSMRKNLKLPPLDTFAIDFKKRGETMARSTSVGATFLRDVFLENRTEKNFRFFCPDETDSNKMAVLFEATKRAYMWPLKPWDENMSQDGRVMEILSEHNLMGWLQGYLLTGRHGMFATYEAFATIISSMVDQYAKFLKQSMKLAWRKPISSLNVLLTSVGWRQEHNGYSHQNPGFISGLIEKHGAFCSAYFPPDANSLLVTFEDCLKRKNSINAIVAGKQPLPQWLTLDEARKQLKTGIGLWDFAHLGWKNPDVVLVGIGDYMVLEVMAAVSLMKDMCPELNIRVVNVSELTALGIGDEKHPLRLGENQVTKYFTADRPIIFNFHGYPEVIKSLVWNHPASQRISIHGYREEGTTTTPFDMHVRNGTSRFDIAIDALVRGSAVNSVVAKKAPKLIKKLQQKLTQHQKYILKYGKDMPEIDEWSGAVFLN